MLLYTNMACVGIWVTYLVFVLVQEIVLENRKT